MASCWRCGGSLLEMWWLFDGDVVAHCWRWCGSFLGDDMANCNWWEKVYGSLVEDGVAHKMKIAWLTGCDAQAVEMWWMFCGESIKKLNFSYTVVYIFSICLFKHDLILANLNNM